MPGDALCTSCHEQGEPTGSQAIHNFGNYTSCHMPRIAKSADAGDIRSHIFDAILPFTGTLLIREYAASLFEGSKNV